MEEAGRACGSSGLAATVRLDLQQRPLARRRAGWSRRRATVPRSPTHRAVVAASASASRALRPTRRDADRRRRRQTAVRSSGSMSAAAAAWFAPACRRGSDLRGCRRLLAHSALRSCANDRVAHVRQANNAVHAWSPVIPWLCAAVPSLHARHESQRRRHTASCRATPIPVPSTGRPGGRQKLSTARRVEQAEWSKPVRDDWTAERRRGGQRGGAAGRSSSPIRSACRRFIQAIPQFRAGRGAFLVAPPDVDNPEIRPQHLMTLRPLPARSAAVSVDGDRQPQRSLLRRDVAEDVAAAWGSLYLDAGEAGHINAESGYGPWPEGSMAFAQVPVATACRSVITSTVARALRRACVSAPMRMIGLLGAHARGAGSPSRRSGPMIAGSTAIDGRELAGLARRAPTVLDRRHHVLEDRVDRRAAASRRSRNPTARRRCRRCRACPGCRRARRAPRASRSWRRKSCARCCRRSHSAAVAPCRGAGSRRSAPRSVRRPADTSSRRRSGCASSTELTIGAITASAPKSSARLAMSKRPTGMRTIAVLAGGQHRRQAAQHAVLVVAAVLHVERHDLEVLGRETISTVSASGTPDQAVKQRFPSRQALDEGHG